MTVTVKKNGNGNIEGYECLIGNSKLKLFIKIGGKYGEKDCRLFWDAMKKDNAFEDKILFKCILNSIHKKEDALNFIKLFKEFEYISFNNNRINNYINIYNPSDIQKIVDYVNNIQINDELKKCLASMILRCYVDNNAYPKPYQNGCIRHYIQVLLLLGYKFNIVSWKMNKLNNIITSDIAQNSEKLSEVIFEIGHPKNKYGIITGDFRKKYEELYNKEQAYPDKEI